jgi:membrane-associated phospholipid phosphatase
MAFSMFLLPVYLLLVLVLAPLSFFLRYISCMGSTLLVVSVLKHAVSRKRPNKASLLGHRSFHMSWERLDDDQSFPSGDTSQSAVAMTFIFLHFSLSGAFVFPFFLVCVLVAFGRVYYGRHHIGDTVAGGFLGFLCTIITLSVISL